MKWFSLVYRWRAVSSTVWLCVLAYPLLLLYTATSTLSIYHPVTWATDCVHNLLSVFTFFLCCLYVCSLGVVMVMYALTATVELPVYKTRLHVLWSVLSPAHFLCVLLLGFLGGVKGHILSELSGHVMWSGRGLNEGWWFITLHGVYTGLCYGCTYYTHKEMVLVVPSIQQSRLFSLRGHTLSHIWEGLVCTLKDLRWFLPLYYITRSYMGSKVTDVLGLEWTTHTSLLNFDLLLQVVLSGTFSHSFLSFGLRVFRVFLTQSITFPVVAMFSNESKRLLTDTLKSKLPLLRHLAYLDVCSLAWQACPRRSQVYSLDRSGVPRVWDDVCTQCLHVIDTLTHKLTGVTSSPVTMATKESGGFNKGDVSKGWWSPESPVVTRRVAGERVAQLWLYSPATKIITSQRTHNSDKPLGQLATDKMWSVWVAVKAIPTALAQRLKRKPFFVYFLSTLPGAEESALYADSRVVVWAITGVSELAVASYTEDQYGVVQRSLSKVLASLISLSQALDKHLKIPLSNAPSTRNSLIALERNGKYAIKSAVLTSLHRLDTTFSKQSRAFQLSNEQISYWNTHS